MISIPSRIRRRKFTLGGVGMSKNVWKLTLWAAAGGIVLRFFTQLILSFMMSGEAEWTDKSNNIIFAMRMIMSFALFIGIGLMLKKTYDRRTMMKASTLFALILAGVYLLEQSSFYRSGYMPLLYYLYLPGEIFSWITYALLRTIGTENYSRLMAIPVMLAPYLFMIFTIGPDSSKDNKFDAEGADKNEI